MQPLIQPILAEGDIPTFPIVLAIAFVVWVVGSIASSVKKVAGQQQKQSQAQAPQRRAGARSPVVLPALKQSHPRWTGPQPVQKKQQKRRPPPVPKKVAPAPLPAREPEPILMSLRDSPIVTGATPGPAVHSATAASLHRWLTPKTLRQQFILTEILQPPLTLRENPERF